ncbi:hypothetical protein J2Y69_002159 [Microbacterium resistens]|uniref:Uncharacterized protein n=1 Tax=Microbacterium resistens TaxID=156977 RepID=A0ABU1SD84_9MICO|nr:hypothetical protein [Microbacterium resistens]MDR6867555.1 hypothetical protein [Microbacterium resistens]
MTMKPVGRIRFFTPEVAQQHLVDWLFIETIDDLQERHLLFPRREDRYRVLGIAPLLRKLLLDGGKSLVVAVRRPGNRPAPRFRVRPYVHQEAYPGTQTFLGFNPTGIFGDGDPIGLDQFLRTPIAHAVNQDLTVAQTIRYFANIGGGVHLGRNEIPANEFMRILGPSIDFERPGARYQVPEFFMLLPQIALVVVHAMSDLRAQVEAEYKERDTNPTPDLIADARDLLPLFPNANATQGTPKGVDGRA